jgi:hypothetical protein
MRKQVDFLAGQLLMPAKLGPALASDCRIQAIDAFEPQKVHRRKDLWLKQKRTREGTLGN